MGHIIAFLFEIVSKKVTFFYVIFFSCTCMPKATQLSIRDILYPSRMVIAFSMQVGVASLQFKMGSRADIAIRISLQL